MDIRILGNIGIASCWLSVDVDRTSLREYFLVIYFHFLLLGDNSQSDCDMGVMNAMVAKSDTCKKINTKRWQH